MKSLNLSESKLINKTREFNLPQKLTTCNIFQNIHTRDCTSHQNENKAPNGLPLHFKETLPVTFKSSKHIPQLYHTHHKAIPPLIEPQIPFIGTLTDI